MVHVIFDGSTLRLAQIGGGAGPIAHFEGVPFQRGYGFFAAVPRQRGAGVGAVLRTLWRFLRPLAVSAKPVALGALREIGKEGLETGARALNTIAEGGISVGDAFAAESKEGARRLAEKAAQALKQQNQSGRGQKRRNTASTSISPYHSIEKARKRQRRHQKVVLLPSDVVGKTVPQRALLNKARRDVLGTY